MRNRTVLFYLTWFMLAILFFIKMAFADPTSGTQVIDAVNLSQISTNNSTEGIKNVQPISLSIDQDSLVGWIADVKALLAINPTHAAAVELAAGPEILRANGTYGYALNDKSRIKVTGEYLRENLEFDYLTGDTKQWVGQGAIGAAYEYWLGGSVFKSLQLGSHYSHAGNKDLSDKTISLDDGTTLLDERRIAGGNDWNGTTEAAMRLWPHSLMTVGADYDRVRYDTKYEIQNNGAGDAQGFGGHIRLQQLLNANTQLQLQSLVSQLANTYSGGLDWIFASHKTTVWTVGLNSTYSSDHTTDRRFWTNGVSISIVWDQPQKDKNAVAHFSDPDISAEDLTTWTAIPAVRMPDVLAISDERISTQGTPVTPFQPVTATCPASPSVVYNVTTQTFGAAGGWVQYYPAPGVLNGNFGAAFNSANVMAVPAGAVQCMYNVGINELLLTNLAYQYVTPLSNNWGNVATPGWPLSQQPASTCINGASSCQFQTVDPQNTTKQSSRSALMKNRI